CRTHHRALHRSGDEAAWWKSTDLDPVMIAQRLWRHTRLNGAPIQQHIDPWRGASSVQDADRANPSTPPIDPKVSDRTSQPDTPRSASRGNDGCHAHRVGRQCGAVPHTANGTAFADLMIEGHRETWPV